MEIDTGFPILAAFDCKTEEEMVKAANTLLRDMGCPDTDAVCVLIQPVLFAVEDITKVFKTSFAIAAEVLHNEKADVCLFGLFSSRSSKGIFWGFKPLYWIKCQCTARSLDEKRLLIFRNWCKQMDVKTFRARWVYSGLLAHPTFNWGRGDPGGHEETLLSVGRMLAIRLQVLEAVAMARDLQNKKGSKFTSLQQAMSSLQLTDEQRSLIFPDSAEAVLLDARSLQTWRMVWASMSNNSETRRELVACWRSLEMGLFTVRSTGCAKQHTAKLVLEGKTESKADAVSVHDLSDDVRADCHTLDPACTKWIRLPFEGALRVVAQHRGVMKRGTVYVPMTSVQAIANERYSKRMDLLVDCTDAQYKELFALVRKDKRLFEIASRFRNRFYKTLAPSVRSNSKIPSQDLNNLRETAAKTTSWMAPCMQQFGVDLHLKNDTRTLYAHYLFRSGASQTQVRQHYLPKFTKAYPPQDFPAQWKSIKGEIDWNYRHRMRNEATCNILMKCNKCPLRTGATSWQDAKSQCAWTAKQRKQLITGAPPQERLNVRTPRDFTVYVLNN